MIRKVALIGNGKVANYFNAQFRALGLEVQIFARQPKSESQRPIEQLGKDADLCLICIADRNIEALSKEIPAQTGILAHCSGTVPLSSLSSKHQDRGIIYPLMSITEQSTFALSEVPLCLEASDKSTIEQLEDFSKKYDLKAYRVPSTQRQRLHLAAVIGHNFSNYLYHWAAQELKEVDLPLEILKPLLNQQVKGLDQIDPIKRQTGPAVRGDNTTMETHLKMLKNPELADLYKKLSDLIRKEYEEKL